MGCNSESKEYSVFVETGCKPEPISKSSPPKFSPSLPEANTDFGAIKGFTLNHIEKSVNRNATLFEQDVAEFAAATSEFEKITSIENPPISEFDFNPLMGGFGMDGGIEFETVADGFGELEGGVTSFELSEEWAGEFVVEGTAELEGISAGFGDVENEIANFELMSEEWAAEFVVDGAIELEAVVGGFGGEEIKHAIANDTSAAKPKQLSEEQPLAFTETAEAKITAPVIVGETPKVEESPAQKLEIRLLLGFDPPVSTKSDQAPDAPIEYVPVQSYDAYSLIKRVEIRHIVGNQEKKCIPFATNYTTLDIFTAPDYRPGQMFPFLDLRGHRFDNNTYAANAGIGGRYVPNDYSGFCDMLGFNVYYDYRQGCVGYYQQIGAGIEVLGRRWDFRANGYAPFGARRHIKTCFFNDYVGDFYARRQDIESVSYSFNGEVGYLAVNGKNFSLYMAGGPYFLARGRCCTSTVGVEARIRPKYKDYVALDLSARYDDLFGTIWQAGIIFTLPLYQISNQNERPCGLRDWQIYQSVERFEVMPLSKRSCWETNF